MNYTKNLRLRKPEGGEYYSVDDFNNNVDVLDVAVSEKADKPSTFVQGNLAAIRADGNILDSGNKTDDFAAAMHNHDASYSPIGHANNSALHVSEAEKAAIAAVASKADRAYVDSALLTKVNHADRNLLYYRAGDIFEGSILEKIKECVGLGYLCGCFGVWLLDESRPITDSPNGAGFGIVNYSKHGPDYISVTFNGDRAMGSYYQQILFSATSWNWVFPNWVNEVVELQKTNAALMLSLAQIQTGGNKYVV